MYYLLHQCRRHYLGSFRLLHCLLILGGLGAVLVGTGVTPWPRSLGIPIAIPGFVLLTLDLLARKEHYIWFTSNHTEVTPAPLAAERKLRVRATGWFEVEGKQQIHVWLEGYYRTFPTREHAVIALCTPTSLWGLGRSRMQDDGMWYMFIRPDDILQVQTGDLKFGREHLTGIRLAYRALLPGRFRHKKLRQQDCIAFLGFHTRQEALLVAGDLLYDAPSGLHETV